MRGLGGCSGSSCLVVQHESQISELSKANQVPQLCAAMEACSFFCFATNRTSWHVGSSVHVVLARVATTTTLSTSVLLLLLPLLASPQPGTTLDKPGFWKLEFAKSTGGYLRQQEVVGHYQSLVNTEQNARVRTSFPPHPTLLVRLLLRLLCRHHHHHHHHRHDYDNH